MNLPSREEREAWAKQAVEQCEIRGDIYQGPWEKCHTHSPLITFLRSDTLDRMAEAVRAADALELLMLQVASPWTQEANAARHAYRAARAKLED